MIDPRDVAVDPAYPCAGQPPTAAPDAPGEAMGERRVTTEVLARLCEGFEYHLKTYAHIPEDDQLFMWPRVDPALGLRLLDDLSAMTAERDAATRERDRLREAITEWRVAEVSEDGSLLATWRRNEATEQLIDIADDALTAPAPTREQETQP